MLCNACSAGGRQCVFPSWNNPLDGGSFHDGMTAGQKPDAPPLHGAPNFAKRPQLLKIAPARDAIFDR